MKKLSELKLCKDHKQECKHSEYAMHNCDYCKLITDINLMRSILVLLKNDRIRIEDISITNYLISHN